MSIKWISQILLFILFILLQVWVFNQIHLFEVATPLVYLYVILSLPSDMNKNLVIFLAFLLGLSIDIFSYTLGMHAIATTIVGFSREYVLKLFSPRDMPKDFVPSVRSLGFGAFLKYAGAIILLHHIVFYFVESLSLFNVINVLACIVSSFILTTLIIVAFEGINSDILKK